MSETLPPYRTGRENESRGLKTTSKQVRKMIESIEEGNCDVGMVLWDAVDDLEALRAFKQEVERLLVQAQWFENWNGGERSGSSGTTKLVQCVSARQLDKLLQGINTPSEATK